MIILRTATAIRTATNANSSGLHKSGIPPSDRAARRYTKVHLDFCLRVSTLIGQIGRVPLWGVAPRRYIRSQLFRLAVTVFWCALTASWRQKGNRKRVFPWAIRPTELPSNPSPLSTRDGAQLTFRNNQIHILQISSTLGTTQQYHPTTQSGKESVQLPAVHQICGANRGIIVSLQSRYSSPFTNLRPFLLRNFGRERKHACSF